MHHVALGLMISVFVLPGRPTEPLTPGSTRDPLRIESDSAALIPPPAWLQGDPADSLYRAGRESLNRREYREAASVFASIPIRYPRSGYAGDALYWQAFALYRLGADGDLRSALAALRRQQKKFPAAATHGDAAALERRVLGELARRGDPQAAEEVARAADSVAPYSSSTIPTPPTPPTPPSPPSPPSPPAPPSPPSGGSFRSCSGDSDDMKVAALNALQQMDQSKAGPILRRLLARRDPGTACLRRKAVFLVAQQRVPGTEDILLESVRSDPDLEVRRQAVFWLSQVGTDRAVTALDSVVRFSKDPEIQDKAVFALSQHDSPKAQEALRAYAERAEVPEEARGKAIFWLGQRQTPENAAFLRGLYGRLSSRELRKKILFSLSQMGGEENGRWLIRVAADSSETIEMRKQALFWAGQAGVSTADLTKLYGSVSDREMREQLIFVYSQRKDAAALDKLIDIAKSDPQPEIRKRALFWLGQSDDARALQAIQDIIDQP
jgi:HEAT repeat protein